MRRRAPYRRLAGPLLVSLTLLLAAAAPAIAAPCKNRNLTPRSSNLSKIRSAVRCLLDHERTSGGTAKLKLSAALTKAAQGHSEDMVRKGYFSHDAPDGSTPERRIQAAGYTGGYVGENIAWGSGTYATPRQMVINWMKSAGHRRNILDVNLRDAGVGIAVGSPGGGPGATYTTTFGGP